MRPSMKKKAEKNTDARATEPSVQTTDSEQNQPILVSALDIAGGVELEMKEVYAEAKTQQFLRELLQRKEKTEIIPSYNPTKGFVYESVESIFGEKASAQETTRFLERLSRMGLLRKSFFDSVATCPTCSSSRLTVHTSCVKCKSRQLSKTGLKEHVPCGYIGEREKFSNGRCPKCGRSLDETPYINMGRWYRCKECGEKFEHPHFDVTCRNCGKTSPIDDSNLESIWKYTLNERKRQEVRQNVASLESISKLLSDLDFDIEAPGWVTGEKSGVRHQFSLVAKKEISGHKKIIALDMVVGENEVPTSPIILYIYKTSEISVDLPVFIAVPKFSGSALTIAQGHNILLIEGLPEEEENIARLKKEIQDRLKPKGFFQSLRKISSKKNKEEKN